MSLEFALRTLVRMRTFPVKQFAFGPHFTQQFAFRPGELHADDRGCNKDFIYRCRASRLPCRFCRSSPKQRSPRLYKYLLILHGFSTIHIFVAEERALYSRYLIIGRALIAVAHAFTNNAGHVK